MASQKRNGIALNCLKQQEKLQCHEFGLHYSVLQFGCIVRSARFLLSVLLALIASLRGEVDFLVM